MVHCVYTTLFIWLIQMANQPLLRNWPRKLLNWAK